MLGARGTTVRRQLFPSRRLQHGREVNEWAITLQCIFNGEIGTLGADEVVCKLRLTGYYCGVCCVFAGHWVCGRGKGGIQGGRGIREWMSGWMNDRTNRRKAWVPEVDCMALRDPQSFTSTHLFRLHLHIPFPFPQVSVKKIIWFPPLLSGML